MYNTPPLLFSPVLSLSSSLHESGTFTPAAAVRPSSAYRNNASLTHFLARTALCQEATDSSTNMNRLEERQGKVFSHFTPPFRITTTISPPT